jgi:hypothetical protein
MEPPLQAPNGARKDNGGTAAIAVFSRVTKTMAFLEQVRHLNHHERLGN